MNISARVFRSSIIPPVAIAAASLFIVIVFFWMNQSTIQRENRIKASSAKSNYEDLKRGSMAFATMISSYNDVRLGVDDSRRHLVLGVITPLFKNMNVDIITVHERDGFVIAKGHAPDVFAEQEGGVDYVAAALSGESSQSITAVDGKPALISTSPVVFNNNNVGAVTVGYFLDNNFAQRLSSLIGAEIMITRNGEVIASSLADKVVKRKKKAGVPEKIEKARKKIRFIGKRLDLSHVELQKTDEETISLIIATDNNAVRRALVLIFFACVGFTGLMLAAVYTRAKKFTEELTAPIIKMAQSADRVATGHLDVEPLPVDSKDEVGRLTHAFNVMVSNLRLMVDKDKKQRAYLESQVAKLTTTIDAAAKGDFTARFECSDDDAEFTAIANSLNQMISDLDAMIARDNSQRLYLEQKVTELLEIINAAAQGDFTKVYSGDDKDEIGRLGVALSEMIVDLQSMIEMNKSRRSYLEGEVSQLLKVIEAASEGDFTVVFETRRSDEISRVGRALNQMTSDLKVKIEQIEAMKQTDSEQKETLERQVREILVTVAQATDGDLSVQLPVRSDEQGIIADLKKNLNHMFKRLRLLVSKVRESSASVDSTCANIRVITEQLQEGALRQAESIRKTSRFVDDMAASVVAVVTRSKDMLSLSERTNEDAASGGDTTRKAVAGMRQVGEAMEEINSVMQDLEVSADEIDEIVKAIDEISDQTNLLSLNASIEAARAGDYGRGFSVVAKEISSLAVKSVESTREITTIVRRIQERVKKANESTDRARNRVVEGSALSDRAGLALDKILESINGVTVLIKQTTESIEQRRGEIKQVESSMKDILTFSEETSNLAANAADAVQTLKNLSAELDNLVKKLQTGN
ncbi:MAG: Methyl-accepting chemotaxis protein McpA [bacterium ADurb.Bin236]|nr:MAG: Methyl-accepting chemotaxis protein McpA [bacterium ADurb.Bin236]HPN95490.1 HAMP domain-containing protein [bacterium]